MDADCWVSVSFCGLGGHFPRWEHLRKWGGLVHGELRSVIVSRLGGSFGSLGAGRFIGWLGVLGELCCKSAFFRQRLALSAGWFGPPIVWPAERMRV
jgi:hypothetical protein